MSADRTADLVARARLGDDGALSGLFETFRPHLVHMVALRLDAALRPRLDPDDVVQQSWLEIVRRFPEWRAHAAPPFQVWVRLVTSEVLTQARRHHLAAHMRDARHEIVVAGSRPSVSAASVADVLVGSATTPTQAAAREELRARVLSALEDLEDLDREIVVLRQFEGLSNEDAAVELGIEPPAASKRFVRALARLRPALRGLAPEKEENG
jgi:RNA polymerase sigma-70 factor (ECF subfamily)